MEKERKSSTRQGLIIILKKSCCYSFSLVTGVSTIASLLGYSINDLFKSQPLWMSILFLFIFFLLITIIIGFILLVLNHKGFKININGKHITIKNADIFVMNGLKVIPFNERFDTVVDDNVISHDSLNGKMIDNYVDSIDDLNETIKKASDDNIILKKRKGIYPLGRIIKYKDYLLLAATHFDNKNQAYMNVNEYELMLTNMWDEIRRVYAGKKIVLPLIGSGITTMNGINKKDNTMLLKCMLCTLKRSMFVPKNGITIVLNQDTIDTIEMIKIREEFKYDL